MSTSNLAMVFPEPNEQKTFEFSGNKAALELTVRLSDSKVAPAIQERTWLNLFRWLGEPIMNIDEPIMNIEAAPAAVRHHRQTHDVSYPIYQGRLFQQYRDAINELRKTAKEHNWDGEDGEPVSDEALSVALKVAANIPGYLPAPEIYPDPEGRIEFDWALENGTLFTLTVGPKGDAAMSAERPKGGFLRGWSKNDDGDDTIPDFVAFSLNWLERMAVK